MRCSRRGGCGHRAWVHGRFAAGWDQVRIPGCGRAGAAASGRWLGCGGDDGGQVGGGEPQVLAEEGAWHLPCGGLLAQPRFPNLEQVGGLRRRVQQRRRGRRRRGGGGGGDFGGGSGGGGGAACCRGAGGGG